MTLFSSILKRRRAVRPATACLLPLLSLLWLYPDEVAPVPVRFVEGALHGFLALRTMPGDVVASGDIRQVTVGTKVEARTIFHFKDGSLSDEAVTFTQQKAFSMESYQLVQRGPAFAQDIDIHLERGNSKYRVKAKDHKNGTEKVLDGSLTLPADVYNGMILTVTKNLLKGGSKIVHIVVFTPEPRIIQLQISPADEQSIMIEGRAEKATHYVLHPELGTWLKLLTKLAGRTPPDEHVWVLADAVPAFVKFEGPLYEGGPVWRMELTTPRMASAK